MKESRLNYKVTKQRTKYYTNDFDTDKSFYNENKNKTGRKNKEVRNMERAIKSKDFKALMEDD